MNGLNGLNGGNELNSIIREGSMLSSLSNISVMIKPNEGSSIFNFPLLGNNGENDLSKNLCEVKLTDIFPTEEPLLYNNSLLDNNSMLDKLIKKEEKDSIIPFYPQPILPQVVFPTNTYNEHTWRITQQKGVSEDEADPPEDV